MRVDKSGDCWLWTGVVNDKRGGYGYFYDDDTRLRRAHRVAWELTVGERLGEEQYLLHSCDMPRCVRPSHLRIGTQRENLSEMRAKGRSSARLNPEKVRWLRDQHASGRSQASLARELGLHEDTVYKAVNRINWKHVS